MEILYYIGSVIIGIGIAYLIFYIRYEKTEIIDELRKNLKEANEEIETITNDLDEYKEQNILLKEKTLELLEKNDDLWEVVAELSKYYIYIKKASEKTTELSKFLHEPNPDIEERINKYTKIIDNKDKSFF